jgi:molecular chaperone GrpE (heat shock protein)
MFDSPNFLALILVNMLGVVGILIALRYTKSPRSLISQVDRDLESSDRTAEILALKQECLNLREQLEQQGDRLVDEYREATFQELQSLLTQYKSVQQMVKVKPDLPAKNLIALFTPLDNLLQRWQYEPIGEPWQQVAYNPQFHQGDSPDISEGEIVYVRFVGYKSHAGDILVPAKVSRTIPKVISS